jgi:hypothetical protein
VPLLGLPPMNDVIPAITARRPWPTLITSGHKNVENRKWQPRVRFGSHAGRVYLGPLWIHAGDGWDSSAVDYAAHRGVEITRHAGAHPVGILALAHIVAVCSTRFQWPIADCDCGPWAMISHHHWKLADVEILDEPIQCRGRLGLWYPDPELKDRLTTAPRHPGGGGDLLVAIGAAR